MNKCGYAIIFNLRSSKTPRLDKKKYYIIPTVIKNNTSKVNLINIVKRGHEL